MHPQGREPFPLDAPTPLGYQIGIGRGARPVGSSKEFFQHLKKRKASPSQVSQGEEHSVVLPVEKAEPTEIERSVKQFVAQSKAVIARTDWEDIPEHSNEVARRKLTSGQTVNLGSSLTTTPNALFEATKLIGTTHANTQNASRTVLHEIVQNASGETLNTLPAEYAAESTHLNDLEEMAQQITHLRTLVETAPENTTYWIDLSRLLIRRGEISQAKRVLQKACEANADDESLWLEYVSHVDSISEGKTICGIALENVPSSVALWNVLAEKFTPDDSEKQAVLLEGVEKVPESVTLWKALISSFDTNEEKLLLVETGIQHTADIDLYLLYTHLETIPKRIREKLSEARQKFPDRPEIYIAAARQEAKRPENVEKIIQKALDVAVIPAELSREVSEQFSISFNENSSVVSISQSNANARVEKLSWYALANAQADTPVVLEKIIHLVMHLNARKSTKSELRAEWLQDANDLYHNGFAHASKTLLDLALQALPQSQELWLACLQQVGDENTDEKVRILKLAVDQCPKAPTLWHKLSTIYASNEHCADQCEILERSVRENPSDENLWISLAKATESRFDSPLAALEIYQKACVACPTPRMYLKKFVLDRRIGEVDAITLSSEIEKLLAQGKPFAAEWRLWAMAIELASTDITEKGQSYENARRVARLAVSTVSDNVTIWELAVNIEAKIGDTRRGNTLYADALERMPESSALHAAAIRFAVTTADLKLAKERFETALRHFRHSPSALGDVYAAGVTIEPVETRISAIRSALTICPDHPGLLWEKAFTSYRLGMRDDVLRTAKRLIAVDSRNGDAWALLCIIDQSEAEKVPVEKHKLTNGRYWNAIAKNPIACGHDGCLLDTDDILQLVQESMRL